MFRILGLAAFFFIIFAVSAAFKSGEVSPDDAPASSGDPITPPVPKSTPIALGQIRPGSKYYDSRPISRPNHSLQFRRAIR